MRLVTSMRLYYDIYIYTSICIYSLYDIDYIVFLDLKNSTSNFIGLVVNTQFYEVLAAS